MDKNNIYTESIKNLYFDQDIVIGLTGKTGAGCSTTANILQTSSFDELNISKSENYEFDDTEQRKFKFVSDYLKTDGHWKKFDIIKVSNIIISFMFKHTYEEFVDCLDLMQKVDNKKEYIFINEYDSFKKNCKTIINKGIRTFNKMDSDDYKELKKYYFEDLIKLSGALKNIMTKHKVTIRKNNNTKTSNCYFYLLQVFGNNIRASGNPYISSFTGKHFYSIVKEIDKFIKLKKEEENELPLRICIDAIRNPYEALYLKEKCNNFYLVSVNTSEESRLNRLIKIVNKDEYEHLNYVEYPIKRQTVDEIFYHQNIQKCLELSDIHLVNEDCNDEKYYFLTSQIIRYVALMLHPGLVSPTNIERCMQVAYDARVNSGCLSRKVGAVVTDKNFIIKSIGWNDVPLGQVPCNLRTIEDLITSDKVAFSKYELEDEKFKNKIYLLNDIVRQNKHKCIIPYCYCFKDVYNGLSGANNQVHTRALHAEENAFLNISKDGGKGIEGGYLFVTASPCELCSKKSYQLGIKKIYYIDPYPGISEKHILGFSKDINAPKMELFHGAIGYAYTKLYLPIISPKDELEILTGINPKKIEDNKYTNYKINKEMIIWDLVDNKYYRDINGVVLTDSPLIITSEISFASNTIDNVTIKQDEGFDSFTLSTITKNTTHPYTSIFTLKDNEKNCEKKFRLGIEYKLNPTNEAMPLFMKKTLVKTDEIEMIVILDEIKDNISAYICSDESRREKIITLKPEIKESKHLNKKVYEHIIKFYGPNQKYYYCLDWSAK